MTYLKRLLRQIFKFRCLDLQWIKLYLFEDRRYSLGITLDGNGYWLLCISIIIFHIEIEFAPYSYYHPDQEELDRVESIKNLSEEEKMERFHKNIRKDLFGDE